MLLVSRFLPCPLGVLLPSSPAWKHAPSPSVFTAMDSGPYPAEITALFCEHPCPEHLPKQSSMGGEPKDGQVLRIRDGKKWRQAPCPNTAFSQSHYLPVRTFGSEPRKRHCPASCSIMHGYKMAVRALAAQPAWASHHEKNKEKQTALHAHSSPRLARSCTAATRIPTAGFHPTTAISEPLSFC